MGSACLFVPKTCYVGCASTIKPGWRISLIETREKQVNETSEDYRRLHTLKEVMLVTVCSYERHDT